MAKDFWRKLKVQEQLTKAKFLESDEFRHSEVVDSTCYILGGYVSTNGEAPSIEKEASMLGYEVTEHLRLFEQNRQQEFEARDDKGRLYSPEVLQELHIRKVRSEAGKASADSRLFEQKGEQKPQQKGEQNPNYNYNDNSDSPEGEGAFSALSADPDWFEECWNVYPKRAGSNSKKAAYKAVKPRLSEPLDDGTPITEEILLEATRRYAEEVRLLGRENTEYVKQGSTFYGPGGHVQAIMSKDYEPPKPGNGEGVRRNASKHSRKKREFDKPYVPADGQEAGDDERA